jgi:N-acetylglucosamine-6-phosphate deacetylase
MIVARDFERGCWLELAVDGGLISAVRQSARTSPLEAEDDWVAPAFWDLQINGRTGHSFSSGSLTVDQVVRIVCAQAALGTARICPTLITASLPDLEHGLRTIAAACDADADVTARVLGIHLEGPFLSELDGYRGAHRAELMRDPDWDVFQKLQKAAGQRIVLITMAPERAGAIDFIRKAVSSGVAVALGHTSADESTIRAAVRAGASLSTHLGNGIAAFLPRHPNPIWVQAASDELAASFIADGHHLGDATLRTLARAKGASRTILVSDASPLAGLPPGRYGDWEVDPAGKVIVAGTPYLAGSNQALETGVRNLLSVTGWSLAEVLATVTVNPARLLHRPAPCLKAGEPANLVVFRRPEPHGFRVQRCSVDGSWVDQAGLRLPEERP